MSTPLHIPTGPILVIGFGNTLRRDDGAGPAVASIVSGWERSGVEAIAVQQLTPELAERLAVVRLAVFVDVRLATEGDELQAQAVEPSLTKSTLGHACDPRMLLALAKMVYGSSPRSWMLTIPATDLELGEDLSPTALRGMEAALLWIALLLRKVDEGDKYTCQQIEAIGCTRSG